MFRAAVFLLCLTAAAHAQTLVEAAEQGDLRAVKVLFRLEPENTGRALYFAASRGHLPIVRYMTRKRIDLKPEEFGGSKALVGAAENGHLNVVRFLVRKGVDVNEPSDLSTHALMAAMEKGHIRLIRYLVRHGADIRVQESIGTPLSYAAAEGHLRIVRFLVRKGVNVNDTTAIGETALLEALQNRHSDVAQYLIERGAAVNVISFNDVTPLMIAAENHDIVSVRLMVQRGADVNAKAEYDNTPLHGAVGQFDWNMKVVRYLLEHGADPSDRELRFSVYLGATETPDLLLAFGANPNVPYVLSNASNMNLVRCLVEKGADPHLGYAPGWTVRDRGINRKPFEKIRYLTSLGVMPQFESPNEQLYFALAMRDWDLANEAIEACADLNLVLPVVSDEGLFTVQYLVERGADIRSAFVQHTYSQSVLEGAARTGDLQTVQYLVERGINLRRDTVMTANALNGAVYFGHLPVVEYLVAHGAEVNGKNARGQRTPLEAALDERQFAAAIYLVEQGAEVNVVYDGGAWIFSSEDPPMRTPLHRAVLLGNEALVRTLVEHGAHINARTESGETSLRLVRKHIKYARKHKTRDQVKAARRIARYLKRRGGV